MQVLVTGGAGFIGSAVIRKALQRGFEIINVDSLTYAANLDNLKGYEDHEAYTFVKADIRDKASMRELLLDHRPDAVMHLAAESHVDRSIEGPEDFLLTNIMGTFNLLQAARELVESGKKDFRFHHVSTDEVFGSLGAEGLFSETTPYSPNSPYSSSKASSDFLVKAWSETYDLPVVTTNCSNNYGPCQFPEKLIPVVILNALEGRPIPVYGKGENVRDWLYVDDHADALLLVLEKGGLKETYNIGGNNEKKNIDLVHTICTLMDKYAPKDFAHESLIKFVTDRPGHDLRYAIDATKIKRDLGWEPSVTVEEGLDRTVRWYLENDWWWKAVRERGFKGERLGLANKPGKTP